MKGNRIAISERTNAPYSELGKLLDGLARERNVRGPYAVAKWVTATTGYRVAGQTVSRIFYGYHHPGQGFIGAFAEAFDLTPDERGRLAWLYTYGRAFSSP